MFALAPMLLILSTHSAPASSLSWTGGNAIARAACIKAAGLTGMTATSLVLSSDDAAAKTAVLINVRYRQSFMPRARSPMLCLYDRRTRQAEAQGARWGSRG